MIRVEHGDCREVILVIPDCSVDSCVTDPPYALVSIQKRFGKASLGDGTQTGERIRNRSDGHARTAAGFMGQNWDTGEVPHDPAWWAEVYRVLKPGAHLVAFGGTRTYHRMVCAIEDAGFEIRDMLSWNYGTGFPKSHDVSKSIDKAARGVPHGGADPTSPNHGLYKTSATEGKRSEADAGQGFGAGPGQFMAVGKPGRRMRPGVDQNKSGSWEKLDDRTYQPGTYSPASTEAQQWAGWGTALKPALEPIVLARKPLSEPTIAANVLKWGTGALNIDACRIDSGQPISGGGNNFDAWRAGEGRDDRPAQHGEKTKGHTMGRWPANLLHDNSDEVLAAFPESAGQLAYVGPENGPKPSINVYGNFAARPPTPPRGDSGSAARFFFSAKADKHDRWGSKHPTVKPVDLIRWLARLVTPPGGTILDPFAGSGPLGVAALAEGFNAILIEREAAYIADIKERLAFYEGTGRHSMSAKNRSRKAAPGTLL